MAVLIVCLIGKIQNKVTFEKYVYEPEFQDNSEIVLDGCKLLALGENYIDLQKNDGSVFRYQKSESMQIFDKLNTQKTLQISDLKIGSTQASFVVNGNREVIRAYTSMNDVPDRIRVVIQGSNYSGRYHDRISFTSSSNVTIRSGRKCTVVKAGNPVVITKDSSYFLTNHIVIEPENTNMGTMFDGIERATGQAVYKGGFEVLNTEQGLVLINEVDLDEYLYRVVPSEMPASYPYEALKAQAICARTYAMMHMIAGTLRALGAHVDDSTSFQVYGNIARSESTNQAVDDTRGQLLYSGDCLCETYFYSTSCGYSSGMDVWHVKEPEKYDYLQPVRISADSTSNPDAMADEQTFRTYLQQDHPMDYEKDEPFYRWSYTTVLDKYTLVSHINDRKKASEELVVWKSENGSEKDEFSTLDVGDFQNIVVTKRLAGGAMDEVTIAFEHATAIVTGERNIREILVGTDPDITLNHGVKRNVSTLLPSAFAYIDLIYREDEISGYRVSGGGYGHGIGMSQNGAKHMANEGLSCEQILQVFYNGEVRSL